MSQTMDVQTVSRRLPDWLAATLRLGGRLTVLILALLVAVAAAVAIATNALVYTLGERDTYHEVVRASRLSERAPALAADALFYYGRRGDGEFANYAGAFTHQAWLSVAETVAQPAWVEASVRSLADSTFEWLQSPVGTVPEVSLSLAPVLTLLQGEQGALTLLPLLERTPLCDAGETQLTFVAGGLLACLPEWANVSDVARLVAARVADELPPVVTFGMLAESEVSNGSTVETLAQVKAGWQSLQQAATLALRGAIFLFLLYALAHSRSWRTLLRSLSFPLLAGAVLAGVLLVSLHLVARAVPARALLGPFPFASSEVQASATDGLVALVQAAQGPWLVGVAFLVGLALATAVAPALIKRLVPATEPARTRSQRQQIRRRFR